MNLFVERQNTDCFVDHWHLCRQNELAEVVIDYASLHLGYFHVDKKPKAAEDLKAQIAQLKAAVKTPKRDYAVILVCRCIF